MNSSVVLDLSIFVICRAIIRNNTWHLRNVCSRNKQTGILFLAHAPVQMHEDECASCLIDLALS